MNLLFVSPDLADNSLGRIYSLWCVAEHLGWTSRVIGQSSTGVLWGPLAHDSFAQLCHPVGRRLTPAAVRRSSSGADVIVVVKAVPASFGQTLRAHRHLDVPIILDVDDDDLGHWLDHLGTWQRRGLLHPKHVLRRSLPHQLRRLRELTSRVPLTVSNPVLRARYGGAVVPHVRVPKPPLPTREVEGPVVGFLGTPRPHKGIGPLRAAVRISREAAPWTLVVTAPPPLDARPWERWIGHVPMNSLRDVLSSVDVVAVPSDDSDFSRHQLPVKLIDGLLASRPVLASDLPVIRWATGGHAELVGPGDVEALREGLARLEDRERRTRLASAAREWALRTFTPDAVAPQFEDAVRRAMAS